MYFLFRFVCIFFFTALSPFLLLYVYISGLAYILISDNRMVHHETKKKEKKKNKNKKIHILISIVRSSFHTLVMAGMFF